LKLGEKPAQQDVPSFPITPRKHRQEHKIAARIESFVEPRAICAWFSGEGRVLLRSRRRRFEKVRVEGLGNEPQLARLDARSDKRLEVERLFRTRTFQICMRK
jgi:hypothetical protein